MKNFLILILSLVAITAHAQISVGTAARLSKDSTSKGFVAISKKEGNTFVQNTMRLDSLLKLVDSIVFSSGDFYGLGDTANPVKIKGKADSATTLQALATKLAASNFIVGETPSGSINGSNTVFTLAFTPVNNKEIIYLNGIRQKRSTDYAITSTTITFAIAPSTGDELLSDYLK